MYNQVSTFFWNVSLHHKSIFTPSLQNSIKQEQSYPKFYYLQTGQCIPVLSVTFRDPRRKVSQQHSSAVVRDVIYLFLLCCRRSSSSLCSSCRSKLSGGPRDGALAPPARREPPRVNIRDNCANFFLDTEIE